MFHQRSYALFHGNSYSCSTYTDCHLQEPNEECTELLEGADEWDLDIFKLEVLSDYRPLTTLAMKVLHDRGLINALHVQPVCSCGGFI